MGYICIKVTRLSKSFPFDSHITDAYNLAGIRYFYLWSMR